VLDLKKERGEVEAFGEGGEGAVIGGLETAF
jgi:hypothetical protein